MALKSTRDESSVVLRRISALLRFLEPCSGDSVSANGAHFDPGLLPCSLGDGGIQGFKWYWRGLRIDKDGDTADEFFDQISFA